jgi:predicted metal-binding protein
MVTNPDTGGLIFGSDTDVFLSSDDETISILVVYISSQDGLYSFHQRPHSLKQLQLQFSKTNIDIRYLIYSR